MTPPRGHYDFSNPEYPNHYWDPAERRWHPRADAWRPRPSGRFTCTGTDDVARIVASSPRRVRTARGWLVSCPLPSHGNGRGDRNPSLSVGVGRNGKLLLFCFGGCDTVELFEWYREQGILGRRRS
jgi:hypothetical protein